MKPTLMTFACFAALGLMPATASAESDDSLFGTHWVKFQPLQVGGELQGCELTYLTVQADRVYLSGNAVGVNGSIFLGSGPDKGLGLGLKVGLKDMMTKGSPFERPTFAYLETAIGFTAKAKQQSFDGEDGYRVFVYSAADPAILKIIKELITTSKFSIGYNRREGGMDVLVPLDLMVVDSEYTANQKVIRTRSPKAVKGFSDCALKVIDNVIGKLGGK